ncbi:FAD-dependent oxidoreductase [bacterium]|nr:FAD-dependent oxidoreductase [candidate division CSSED10-310 bacterium]
MPDHSKVNIATSRPDFQGESTHPSDIDSIRTNIPCQWACPAGTDVPGYIEAIYSGDHAGAYAINRSCNMLPGVLGRICSRPCEDVCRHGEIGLGEPVAICHLKRFAADHAPGEQLLASVMFPESGKTAGVVGAGPAGIAAAHTLSIFGHRVTLYDAFNEPGGMMLYGIPDFRLPRDILNREIRNLLRMGIERIMGVRLGKELTVRHLLDKHDAVVLAMGCYRPRMLGIPGENLPGVFAGLDLMMRVNGGETPRIGDTVLVIGGGFTAMDCARTARRLGAKNVSICIRNVAEDLTVTKDEIRETKREGIRIASLVSSTEMIGTDRVKGVKFKRNRFGGARGSSRSVVPIEDSDFVLQADSVISAIGQKPWRADLGPDLPEDLQFDLETGRCSVERLFGAGDFVRGASTVIECIGHGKQVAEIVDEAIMGRRRREKVVWFQPAENTHRKRTWDFIERQEMPVLEVTERMVSQDTEVETGLSPDAGLEESRRCYLCHLRYEIRIPDCIFCRWCIDVCPRNCIELTGGFDSGSDLSGETWRPTTRWNEIAGIVIDSERCIRCGECLRVCPTRCIHVFKVTLHDRMLPGTREGEN